MKLERPRTCNNSPLWYLCRCSGPCVVPGWLCVSEGALKKSCYEFLHIRIFSTVRYFVEQLTHVHTCTTTVCIIIDLPYDAGGYVLAWRKMFTWRHETVALLGFDFRTWRWLHTTQIRQRVEMSCLSCSNFRLLSFISCQILEMPSWTNFNACTFSYCTRTQIYNKHNHNKRESFIQQTFFTSALHWHDMTSTSTAESDLRSVSSTRSYTISARGSHGPRARTIVLRDARGRLLSQMGSC